MKEYIKDFYANQRKQTLDIYVSDIICMDSDF